MSKLPTRPYGIGLWKFICARWDTFCKLLKFEVGDGSLIRFWDDVWCLEQPLKFAYPELYLTACNKEGVVADFVQFSGEVVHWDVHFTRMVQDWELESISSSLEVLYSAKIKRYEQDKLCWQPSPSIGFQVKSFYNQISSNGAGSFPWKNIWKAKVPPRVAFFSWTAASGKILTLDNLCRRGIILATWCCMCKADGESIDHLLLHFPYAKELWDMIFALFGIHWVMPKHVIEVFCCWQGSMGRHKNMVIWKAIPHCLMWCIWRERNARIFEGCELSIAELKQLFYRLLMEWMTAIGLVRFSNLIEFIDFCSLS